MSLDLKDFEETKPEPNSSPVQASGSIRYTLVKNRFDHNAAETVCKSVSDLVDALCKLRLAPPRGSKDGAAIIFAVFRCGERLKRSTVETVTALGLDVDGDATKGQQFLSPEALHAVMPYAMIAWSTFSSRPSAPRYRAVFPLDGECSVSEFERLWQLTDALTGGTLLDPACKNPDRLFYTPRWPDGAEDKWVRYFDGPRLSASILPADSIPHASGGGGRAGCKKRKASAHGAPVPRWEAEALLEEVLRHPLLRWMREEPDAVSREVWRGVAQNLVAAVGDHPDLIDFARQEFHAVSEGYSGYRWSETDRVFEGAIDSVSSVGPMTFAHMAASGMPEEHWSAGATSLVHAARLKLKARTGGAR